jgi:hypothetical protein
MKIFFPIQTFGILLILIWGGSACALNARESADPEHPAASAEWPAGVPGLKELREEIERSDYPFSLYPIYSWMPRDAWELRGLDTLYWRELAKYGRARQLVVQRRLALAEQSARYLTGMIALGQNTWLFSDARDEVQPNGVWLRMLVHGQDDAGVKDRFLQIKLDDEGNPAGAVFHAGAGVIEQAAEEKIVIADGVRDLASADFPEGFQAEKLRDLLRRCEVGELPRHESESAPEDAVRVSLEIVVPGAHRLVNFPLLPHSASPASEGESRGASQEEKQGLRCYRELAAWLSEFDFVTP